MAAITSGTFDTRAGSGSITIDPDNNTSLPLTSSTASDIAKIKLDYDLEDDEEDASEVYLKLGEITVKFWDRLGSGASLFNELDQITSTTDIDLELDFTTNAGRSWTERYQFRSKNVKYNRLKRETTITAQPKPLSNDTVSDIFTNNPSDVYDLDFYGAGGGVEDCMPASSFIENTVNNLNTGNTDVVDSPIFGVTAESDSVDTYVVLNRGGGLEANTLLFRYAAAEGSVVGSVMGYNYYLNRLSTDREAVISESDAEDYNTSIGLNSYLTIRNIFKLGISSPVGYYSFSDLTGDADGLNDDAKKRLDITFSSGITERAAWSNTNTEYEGFSSAPDGADQTENTTDGEQKRGTTGITVTTGTGATISAGDFITFGIPSDFTDKVAPVYIAATAVSGGELTLETPLTESIGDGVNIWRINDVGVNDIAQKGANSYARAFSATGEREIEITIFGIDTVKPFESIGFDSTFNAPLNGSTYRPSSMVYDLVSDKVKIKAYQIA